MLAIVLAISLVTLLAERLTILLAISLFILLNKNASYIVSYLGSYIVRYLCTCRQLASQPESPHSCFQKDNKQTRSVVSYRFRTPNIFREFCCGKSVLQGGARMYIYIYIYIYLCEPVHNMHEAKWNREKDDADNRRSRTSILRAAISNASNERERHFSSMLWRQSRLERFRSSILHFRGGSKGTSWAFRRSGADSNGTCRAFCGSGARSSGHFEPAAALGQARAAISRASCGSGPGSSGHFEPAAAPGQARAAISSQLRLRARLEVGNLGRCGVFEARQATKPRKTQERVQNPKPPNAETNFKNKYMFAPPPFHPRIYLRQFYSILQVFQFLEINWKSARQSPETFSIYF